MSEQVNRKLPTRSTTVQLLTLYTDPEGHSTQRYRRTDRQTGRQTDDSIMPITLRAVRSDNKNAVLSQEGPRDAAVNFDTQAGRISQWHRVVFLPQHGFRDGLCLQTAMNHLSKRDK